MAELYLKLLHLTTCQNEGYNSSPLSSKDHISMEGTTFSPSDWTRSFLFSHYGELSAKARQIPLVSVPCFLQNLQTFAVVTFIIHKSQICKSAHEPEELFWVSTFHIYVSIHYPTKDMFRGKNRVIISWQSGLTPRNEHLLQNISRSKLTFAGQWSLMGAWKCHLKSILST